MWLAVFGHAGPTPDLTSLFFWASGVTLELVLQPEGQVKNGSKQGSGKRHGKGAKVLKVNSDAAVVIVFVRPRQTSKRHHSSGKERFSSQWLNMWGDLSCLVVAKLKVHDIWTHLREHAIRGTPTICCISWCDPGASKAVKIPVSINTMHGIFLPPSTVLKHIKEIIEADQQISVHPPTKQWRPAVHCTGYPNQWHQWEGKQFNRVSHTTKVVSVSGICHFRTPGLVAAGPCVPDAFWGVWCVCTRGKKHLDFKIRVMDTNSVETCYNSITDPSYKVVKGIFAQPSWHRMNLWITVFLLLPNGLCSE